MVTWGVVLAVIGHFPYPTTPGTGLLLARDTGPTRANSFHIDAKSHEAPCRSDRLQFTSFLNSFALMLDPFGEVFELSLALQSESTTLSKAYMRVKRCITSLAQFKEGRSGKYTNTWSGGITFRWCNIGPTRCSLPFTASPDKVIRALLDEIDVVEPSKCPSSVVEPPWL